MHDRAWPFPGPDADARTCERTLGYAQRCVDVWRGQELRSGGMVLLAAVLGWSMTVGHPPYTFCPHVSFLNLLVEM